MKIVKSGDTTMLVREDGTQEEYVVKHTDFENSTYDIVSKVAYLVGVPKSVFEKDYEPPKMEWYEKLDRLDCARIVRQLSILRTELERHYRDVRMDMKDNLRSIETTEWTKKPVEALRDMGIVLKDYKSKTPVKHKMNQYIININACLRDRINNCRELFPTWLNWEYIRDLFVMPNGLEEAGVRSAAVTYYDTRGNYPYQVYINFPCVKEWNLLYNDKRFVTELYDVHNDYFNDLSRVSDAGDFDKRSIREFLQESERVVLVVDCENAAPYTLHAVLNGFEADGENLKQKIEKIVLFDDVHASHTWDLFGEFTKIPVEHREVIRVKEDKSVVDQVLTASTCRARYVNGVDSFIVVSSDSDYWGMIGEMITDTRFYVMLERDKCSDAFTGKLQENAVPYCFTDRFYSGDADEMMKTAILNKFRELWKENPKGDPRALLSEAQRSAYAEMSTVEEEQFYKRHIHPLIMAAK